MITLEESGLEYTYVDFSEHTTLEKIYYMVRTRPVDMVEGKDGVWKPPDPQWGSNDRVVYIYTDPEFKGFHEALFEKLRNSKYGGYWTEAIAP